ncbi:hypothetical protein AeRB84_017402 [Aphanomyces euteiches]|nr:hypothetical protein AeRB84_017402 [Aphanomyces euteiches]
MLWATREFKLDKPPSKSTITRILQAKSRLKDLDTDDVQAARKQIHPFTSSELETQLWSWFQDKENDCVALSGQLITMKAQSILETIGHGDQLKLSSGWLTGFKKRHNIREFVLHGESGHANHATAENAIPELTKLTESYALRDIFNCDESGLPWNAQPSRSLATKPRPGRKQSKKRVSVLFTANADGSEKLPLLSLGLRFDHAASMVRLHPSMASLTVATKNHG